MLNKSQSEIIVKNLREMANVFESAYKSTSTNVVEEAEVSGSKRGRKPGPVSDDVRCEHINDKTKERCMNRATQGAVCRKHPATE